MLKALPTNDLSPTMKDAYHQIWSHGGVVERRPVCQYVKPPEQKPKTARCEQRLKLMSAGRRT